MKNRLVTHLRATIIKLGISCQVTVIFQMRGVIKLTVVTCFIIFWIFFVVKTDTVVVQVAKEFTVIQVLDAFFISGMVYLTSFSKEVVVWKHHRALSLSKWTKLKYDYKAYFSVEKKLNFAYKFLRTNLLKKFSDLSKLW